MAAEEISPVKKIGSRWFATDSAAWYGLDEGRIK